jgi:hypothetical protein
MHRVRVRSFPMSGGPQQVKEVKCARAVIGAAQRIDGSRPSGPQGMRQYPRAGTEGFGQQVYSRGGAGGNGKTSDPLGNRKDRVPRDGGAGRREQVLNRLLDARHAEDALDSSGAVNRAYTYTFHDTEPGAETHECLHLDVQAVRIDEDDVKAPTRIERHSMYCYSQNSLATLTTRRTTSTSRHR